MKRATGSAGNSRSAAKNAIRGKVPQLDREAMKKERDRFWQAEREKDAIRGRLERLREERKGA